MEPELIIKLEWYMTDTVELIQTFVENFNKFFYMDRRRLRALFIFLVTSLCVVYACVYKTLVQ